MPPPLIGHRTGRRIPEGDDAADVLQQALIEPKAAFRSQGDATHLVSLTKICWCCAATTHRAYNLRGSSIGHVMVRLVLPLRRSLFEVHAGASAMRGWPGRLLLRPTWMRPHRMAEKRDAVADDAELIQDEVLPPGADTARARKVPAQGPDHHAVTAPTARRACTHSWPTATTRPSPMPSPWPKAAPSRSGTARD